LPLLPPVNVTPEFVLLNEGEAKLLESNVEEDDSE
jgi:hypothetical protein